MLMLWDRQENLYTPMGVKFTPEQWESEYPILTMGVPVVLTMLSPVQIGGMETLYALCERYGVSHDLSDNEQFSQVKVAIEFEKRQLAEQANQPTSEERIAAAMEFQNLLAL